MGKFVFELWERENKGGDGWEVGTGKRSEDLFNEAEGLFLFLANCEAEAPIIEVERNSISDENAVEFFPEIIH
jgi:hypothetical protein